MKIINECLHLFIEKCFKKKIKFDLYKRKWHYIRSTNIP